MQVITLLYCGRGFWEILRHCLSFFFSIFPFFIFMEKVRYTNHHFALLWSGFLGDG